MRPPRRAGPCALLGLLLGACQPPPPLPPSSEHLAPRYRSTGLCCVAAMALTPRRPPARGCYQPPPIALAFRSIYTSDRDKDGFPDQEDCCPLLPEDFDSVEDGDGCPDCDDDDDGVPELGLLEYDDIHHEYSWLPGPTCDATGPGYLGPFGPPSAKDLEKFTQPRR